MRTGDSFCSGATALVALVTALALAAPGAAVENEWIGRWTEDLETLRGAVREVHPDPFQTTSSEQLDRSIDRLIADLARLEQHEVVVELARIVAALGDGHTRVTLPIEPSAGLFLGHSPTPLPDVPGLIFRPLPVRLLALSDGVFVDQIDTVHAELVGARVLSIGSLPIDRAIEQVAPVVHRDNEHQLRYQLPDFLILPEVLHARGVIERPGSVELEVELASGQIRTVRLDPWASSDDGRGAPELARVSAEADFRRENQVPFWFEERDAGRTLYWQYNEVGDGPHETLADFSDRLFERVEGGAVERLVIDLRNNRGGSNGFNRPLLHHLLRSAKLQEVGTLFAIVGGGTFSAAMMFAVDLERHTPVIFVGEPTGSRPNHYGDSRKIELPNTGLTVRVSTLYWQYSDPRDQRREIAPHLVAPLTGAALRSGRDPSLEAIEQTEAVLHEESWGGVWSGTSTVSHARQEVALAITAGHSAETATLETATLALPGLGLAPTSVDELGVEGGRIRFELTVGETHIEGVGRREGGRLYGTLTAGPQSYPFALERGSEALESPSPSSSAEPLGCLGSPPHRRGDVLYPSRR